jgi:hypothetical protein
MSTAERVREEYSHIARQPLRIASEASWASVTFKGLKLTLRGAEPIAPEVGEAEVEIAGMLVVDARASGRDLSVVIVETEEPSQ